MDKKHADNANSLPLIEINHLTFSRLTGPPILKDLSWTIREGETWAMVGPVGAGKSTLAALLCGKHLVPTGSIRWPLIDRLRELGRSVNSPSEVIKHVSFREESRLFSYSGYYYQQRFEFADIDAPLTLEQFLRQGSSASDEEVHSVAGRLGVEACLSRAFMKLSNGQSRRARIARALLAKPELLILDDPFLGLDTAGRTDVADFLGNLVVSGLRLILITPQDALPSWVTHMLTLRREAASVAPTASTSNTGIFASVSQETHDEIPIELRNVTVAHGGQEILRDVNWTVKTGERWAVLGPNGSGKTTLLSLLCGDHPQAYCNDVRLFGRRRGTGESIWDVKRRVGLVSPELHLYFTAPLSAARTAATGFFDVLTDRLTTLEQDAVIRTLFDQFGISALANRPFAQLSTGEQRLVLLVRALVKRPPLLILDEPFQGLDTHTMEMIRDWLDGNLGADQTLLVVSHHAEEIPGSVTRRLRLDAGRVVEIS